MATVCLNKAIHVEDLGDRRGAVALYDRAIAILEPLVEQDGRRELKGNLAKALAYRARTQLWLGEIGLARADARRAVPDLRAEAARTGRADLQTALDWAIKNLKALL